MVGWLSAMWRNGTLTPPPPLIHTKINLFNEIFFFFTKKSLLLLIYVLRIQVNESIKRG